MKRIVTIQDISCLGKCSLTVALPIISAMGVECAIIPTAVLSTHTMFKNFTFHDLTEEINPIVDHWEKEKIDFDAVYTGYLGSFEQIEIVSGVFEKMKAKGSLVCVDPAMADKGKLYPAFNEAFALKMAELCANADFVLPNITEAAFMTESEYKECYDEEYVRALILALAAKGAKNVILTGVSFEEGKTGVMGYDSKADEFYYYSHKKQSRSYHGTGDIFSSTAVGALMRGNSLPEALVIAGDYTKECIRITAEKGKLDCYGVDFEEVLPDLMDRING